MGLLEKIKKGNMDTPLRMLLYGVEGIGKSTFAAASERPIFACAEDGLGPALTDVERVNIAAFPELLELIRDLRTAKHEYKTLVIDTADWLEAMIYAYICQRDSKSGIEDYGYGKGYMAAQQELRLLLSQLDLLRTERGMHLILLAHALIKPYQNPVGDNYDRFIMKGNEKITGLLREWADVVLFARYEVFVTKDNKKAVKGKAVMSNARIMHTTWTPAWDAKNRMNLPEVLPLSWDAFVAASKANLNGGDPAEAAELAGKVKALFEAALFPNNALKTKALERLGGSLEVASLARNPVSQLRKAADYLQALQPAKEEAAAAA